MKVNHYDEFMTADDFVHEERVEKLKQERTKSKRKLLREIQIAKLPKENDMEVN